MKIVIAYNNIIPALKYGGVERVVWYLGEELTKLGHTVTFLVPKGSVCPFAKVVAYNPFVHVGKQVPQDTDIVNFHFLPDEEVDFPCLFSIHGNLPPETRFYPDTHFVSANHANRYGSSAFIYNGLNWDDYGSADLNHRQNYCHFLGKAAWKVKNVKGAIRIAHLNKTEIKILGGSRINFKMGFKISFSRWASFYGMVGGEEKNHILRHSKALIFPVLWHEPFGLAIIESLYFGCPVIGTTYGSLPELVKTGTGLLSNSMDELTEGFKNVGSFSRKLCHEYARDEFNSAIMAKNYLKFYERILNGYSINIKPPAFISNTTS